ncbi:MAG: hypothetical protein E7173_01960 [Firmicutes bacterium]|nr:hypothetical protein [Bacillota bacterium]
MKKTVNIVVVLLLVFSYFYFPIQSIMAESYEVWSGYTAISGSLTVHSTPALGDFNYVEEIPPYISFRVIGQEGDFYKIVYGEDNREGWVYYQTIKKSSEFESASYGRPWTTPLKAISGGAELIAESYIAKGQFTSYLKKFQVNPNAEHGLYQHQYMTNIRAPYYEARTSYKAYSQILNDVAFTFTIPVFNNMPDETLLTGMTNQGVKMTADELAEALTDTEYSAEEFETKMTEEGFPESYKLYLRSLYASYPQWSFEALNTNIEWATAIASERSKSCIEVSSGHGTNDGCGNESANWAIATEDAVKYFMDPRNFLSKESIFMFENLSSYANVTESMVQRILSSTFMSGKSEKDNMNYATIFINAGIEHKINPVYLASLSIQEVGTNGSAQTRGEAIEWYGLRFTSLYNFYNIGATGTFTAKGGIVWAGGGSPDVFEFVNDLNDEIEGETPSEPETKTDFPSFITNAGYKIEDSYIKDIEIGTKISDVKQKMEGINISVKDLEGNEVSDDSRMATNFTLILSDGQEEYLKTIIITGDINGDGDITSRDYIMIEEKLMGTKIFDKVQEIAGDLNNDLRVNSRDYILVEEYLLTK